MLTDQERLRILKKIVRISQELTAITSIENLLHKIVMEAAELTRSEVAGILLGDQATHSLRFVAATNDTDRLFDIPVPMERSIAGAVFQNGRPEIVADVRQDPRFYAVVGQIVGLPAHSLLAVPLVFKEYKIGVLEAENKISGQAYDQDDVETLTLLAAHATIAIQNVRMLESLQQAREQVEQRAQKNEEWLAAEQGERKLVEALGRASAWLSSTLDAREVVDRILNQIGRIVPHDATNLIIIEEGKRVRVFRGQGYERFGATQTLDAVQIDLADVPGLRKIMHSGQPLLIPDVMQDDTWIYSRPEQTWIRSYIGLPILAQERVIGFISVQSATPNAFMPKDVERLQEFSRHVAIAITNAWLHQQAQDELSERIRVESELRLHRDHLEELVTKRTSALAQSLQESERLREESDKLNEQLQLEIQARKKAEENLRLLAITDPLTGAFNRRHLWLLSEQALKQAQRYKYEITALMLDADHFKQINDTYGHAAGDEVLQILVNYLHTTLRKSDILARYGGEEFVILMPETNLETGLAAAERILAGVRQLRVATSQGPIKFTVSIGVSIWRPGDAQDIESLVTRADQGLYAAKQSGRDRVVSLDTP